MSIGHYTAIRLLETVCPVGGTVVDVGAFPGHLTRQLASNGWQVIALDRHPQRGIQTSRSGKAAGPRFCDAMAQIGVQTLEVDIERGELPLASESVDAVVMTEVIEHLYVNPLFALCEINRVLKQDGTLLVSTPNLLSLRNRINFACGKIDRVIQRPFDAFLQDLKFGHKGHVRLYAPQELRAMLTALGFAVDFKLHSFDFWDEAPAVTAKTSQRCSFMRKFIRPPASYWKAGLATARMVLERAIPELRPHMYVIARKKHASRLDDLTLIEAAQQVAGPETSADRGLDAPERHAASRQRVVLQPAAPDRAPRARRAAAAIFEPRRSG